MRLPNAVVLALIAAVATVGWAAASAIPTTARPLAGGTAVVSACDTDGFSLRHTIDTTGHVTAVTVASMAAPCAGGTLRVTLTNGTSSVGAGASALPSSGFTGTATVTISPAPLSSGVTALYIAVEGP